MSPWHNPLLHIASSGSKQESIVLLARQTFGIESIAFADSGRQEIFGGACSAGVSVLAAAGPYTRSLQGMDKWNE